MATVNPEEMLAAYDGLKALAAAADGVTYRSTVTVLTPDGQELPGNTVLKVTLEDERLVLSSSLEWEVDAPEAYQGRYKSQATYRLSAEAAATLAHYDPEALGRDEDGNEPDVESMSLGGAFGLLLENEMKQEEFGASWRQTYPFGTNDDMGWELAEVELDENGDMKMSPEDKVTEYHEQTILATTSTDPALCMLSDRDMGQADPQEIITIYGLLGSTSS